ncbi:MAG: proton-conducting transporter membrane subunit [Candidatus Ratteibacteria bacterium]|nr:proton-conducting transporter membrane subunit [Candidatus Ratteibacteria bacterium]
MAPNELLLWILVLPFIAAVLVKLLPARWAIKTGLFFLIAQLVMCGLIKGAVFSSGFIYYPIKKVLFIADPLSFVFGITSVFVGVFIYLFATGYFLKEVYHQQQTFSVWGLMLVGSMMGVVFSDNLISLYMFWELSCLCSWKLIGLYREDKHLLAADKAFLITTAGAGLMLLGIAYIYAITGSLSIAYLINQHVPWFVFVLFFIGVITVSATFPFHTYLLDASVAPAPVTSFLYAAVLVNIGIYGLARLFGATLTVSGNVILAGEIALFSSFAAGIVAMRETDINRVLAFSTISQIGFMIAGLVVFNPVATRGVVIFYAAHSLGNGCLLLCAGLTEKLFGTKDIRQMGGLMKRSPLLTYAFLFSMLSVIGISPLPGSYGRLEVITGILIKRHIFYGLFAILTSALTLIYMFRLFRYVFMGDAVREVGSERPGFVPMMASVVIIATASLLVGIILAI